MATGDHKNLIILRKAENEHIRKKKEEIGRGGFLVGIRARIGSGARPRKARIKAICSAGEISMVRAKAKGNDAGQRCRILKAGRLVHGNFPSKRSTGASNIGDKKIIQNRPLYLDTMS